MTFSHLAPWSREVLDSIHFGAVVFCRSRQQHRCEIRVTHGEIFELLQKDFYFSHLDEGDEGNLAMAEHERLAKRKLVQGRSYHRCDEIYRISRSHRGSDTAFDETGYGRYNQRERFFADAV